MICGAGHGDVRMGGGTLLQINPYVQTIYYSKFNHLSDGYRGGGWGRGVTYLVVGYVIIYR